MEAGKRAHAMLFPFPCSGHINPTLKLAELLHSRGVHVTFVNTDHNHERLRRPRGRDGFRFESVPDGLDDADRAAPDKKVRLYLSAVAAEDLHGPAGGPGAAGRGARGRAARHLRRLQRPRQLRARRRGGAPRAVVRALGHQRRRLRLHAPAAPAPTERLHAAQRRELPTWTRRSTGSPGCPRCGSATSPASSARWTRPASRCAWRKRRPTAAPWRRASSPTRSRRARVRRPGRAPGRVPAGVHHRATRRRHAPPRRPRPRRGFRPKPLGGGRGLYGLAGRAAGAGLCPLRQLRQPRRAVAGPARGVRLGPRCDQPPVPLGRAPRPRRRRSRHRRPAGRVHRGDQGPVLHRRVVRAGAGAAAPRRGRLPDAQRMELHDGEHLGGRADDLRARVRGPVHQQPVRVRGVERRAAPGRAAAAGAGGGARRGVHGRRGEGRGDEAQRRRVEGEGRGRHGARRIGVRKPREAGRGAAGAGTGRRPASHGHERTVTRPWHGMQWLVPLLRWPF